MKQESKRRSDEVKRWKNSLFFCKECGADHKKLRVVGWTENEETSHRPKVWMEPNGLYCYQPDYYCWSCTKKLKLPFDRRNAKDRFYPAFDDVI